VEVTAFERATLAAGVRLGLAPSFTPRRWRRYLDGGGGLVEAAGAGAGLLARRLRMGHGEARKLAREIRRCDPAPELEEAARTGVGIVAWGQPGFPSAFGALADPPPVLYVRGSLHADDGVAAAVVGSRRATDYGLRVARTLGADLARAGVTVVAGLARGIDAAAHRGALEAGGRTVAVLGSGLLEPYPPEHIGLIENIAASGAVVSEFPLHAPPRPAHFPQRNRLVAALSLAVVVVEAAERSGALSTARHALDLGREVVAVPGCVDSPVSQGITGDAASASGGRRSDRLRAGPLLRAGMVRRRTKGPARRRAPRPRRPRRGWRDVGGGRGRGQDAGGGRGGPPAGAGSPRPGGEDGGWDVLCALELANNEGGHPSRFTPSLHDS
jgi:DNA processing protein